jgi:hypothetical protein
MKNLIVTASDSKYGEFLINHWLASLVDNVNLENIDVVVFDYGLTEEQTRRLKSKNVAVVRGVRDGHVTSIRFRDMAVYLPNCIDKYSQVLCVDSGDIVFQDDVSHIFEYESSRFRAVEEDWDFSMMNYNPTAHFSKEDSRLIKDTLIGKKLFNAGVIFAPMDKFIELCKTCDKMTKNKSSYGPDQFIVNYVMHKSGNYATLPRKYNLILGTSSDRYIARGGEFFIKNGSKAVIVHNAGNIKIFRIGKNFGYKQTKMRVSRLKRIVIKTTFKAGESIHKMFIKSKTRKKDGVKSKQSSNVLTKRR